MTDGVLQWLKELTVFMVICETILSFSPTASYKKYIKPFVGLIVLLWMTSFLFGTVDTDWGGKMEEIFLHYESSVSQYLEHMELVEREEKPKKETQWNLEENHIFECEKLNENIINIDKIVIEPIKVGEFE